MLYIAWLGWRSIRLVLAFRRGDVAEIISLDDKIELSREKKATLRRRQKAVAVRRVVQCTSCSLKCEKCGTQVEPRAGAAEERQNLPYHFCEACDDEYRDYIERLQGRGDADCYWHNDAWMKVWESWLEHQRWLDQYRQSKEFLQLLQEVEDLFKK